MANILFVSGIVLIIAALLWWAAFYGNIVKELGGELSDAFSCLYSGDGACGLAAGIAQMVGKTPYSPFIFWSGALSLTVGGLMKAVLKPTSTDSAVEIQK